MSQVLTQEQSFLMMEKRFAALREHDVIDLCWQDSRFPAVVTEINLVEKSFKVVSLGKQAIRSVLAGEQQEPIVVQLPSAPSDRHPAWSVVGR